MPETSRLGPAAVGDRHLPYAFTEQGVTVLSSVPCRPRAAGLTIAL
jgi:hypothetical protein